MKPITFYSARHTYANQYLYVTSTEAYKEGKEARLERRRAERINEKVDDTFAE